VKLYFRGIPIVYSDVNNHGESQLTVHKDLLYEFESTLGSFYKTVFMQYIPEEGMYCYCISAEDEHNLNYNVYLPDKNVAWYDKIPIYKVTRRNNSIQTPPNIPDYIIDASKELSKNLPNQHFQPCIINLTWSLATNISIPDTFPLDLFERRTLDSMNKKTAKFTLQTYLHNFYYYIRYKIEDWKDRQDW